MKIIIQTDEGLELASKNITEIPDNARFWSVIYQAMNDEAISNWYKKMDEQIRNTGD